MTAWLLGLLNDAWLLAQSCVTKLGPPELGHKAVWRIP